MKNRFIYLITSGYYLPGDQLPTVRGLAADVEVNYNTVSKVYMSLEQDGYIQSKRRQGAFVCDVSDKPGVSIASTAEIVTVEYLKRCFELGMSLEDVEAQFNACLADAKAKRDKEGEAKDDEANEDPAKRARAGSSFSPDARKTPSNVQLETGRRRASRNGAVVFGLVVFAVAAAVVLVVAQVAFGGIGVGALALAVVAGWLAASSIHVVLEWEKAVVLRLGKFNRVADRAWCSRGPSSSSIPCVSISAFRPRIRRGRNADQRLGAHQRGRGGVLDGVLGQEGVRGGGRLRRGRVVGGADHHAQGHRPCDGGRGGHAPRPVGRRAERGAGGKAVAVGHRHHRRGVRDIVVPKELQEAMAIEAVAERRKNARMVLAEVERDISEMLKDASDVYGGDQDALRLRTMHLAYESVEKSGGTLVIPSAFSEGFVDSANAAGSAAGAGAGGAGGA